MEKPQLYTNETNVFANGVSKADITKPITVLTDEVGNHALTDGNHRAFRAFQDGKLEELLRSTIETIRGDVSQNPDYRHISHLKVIDK